MHKNACYLRPRLNVRENEKPDDHVEERLPTARVDVLLLVRCQVRGEAVLQLSAIQVFTSKLAGVGYHVLHLQALQALREGGHQRHCPKAEALRQPDQLPGKMIGHCSISNSCLLRIAKGSARASCLGPVHRNTCSPNLRAAAASTCAFLRRAISPISLTLDYLVDTKVTIECSLHATYTDLEVLIMKHRLKSE